MSDKLREAIWLAKRAIRRNEPQTFTTGEMKALVAAAESTLPRTKMVEVWRVEWAIELGANWAPCVANESTEMLAHYRVDKIKEGPESVSCIRVTGPHQQEVPA